MFYLSREKLGRSFRAVEAKGWLGRRVYQVRDKISLKRHFILVFCAYTFIITASVNWRFKLALG